MTTLLESRIQDLSTNAWGAFGNVFTQNVVQAVRREDDGNTNFNTHYYSLDGEGVPTKVGGMNFLVNDEGKASMNFSAVDQAGEQVPLLDMSPDGIQISGQLTVLGDGIEFNSPNLEVSDESINLASDALSSSDIDQGGFILGTEDSGKKTFLYSLGNDTWSTNASINLEAGYGLTVANDQVVLNEVGLTIGDKVSISSTGMTLGSVSPVSITALGIELGDDISLTVASGLNIDDSVLLTSSALTIGTVSPVVLDGTGLVVGDVISLNEQGLRTGDVSLDSGGLIIGTDITLSVSDGLTIGELGSVGATVLDNTSLQLGESVLLNQEGLNLAGEKSSIFFGPASEWKISYDHTTSNILFQYYDSPSESYVTKMELKSAGQV